MLVERNGNKRPGELTTLDVTRACEALEAKGYADTTLQTYFSLMRTLLRNWGASAMCVTVVPKKRSRAQRSREVSEAEYTATLAKANRWLTLVMLLCREAALRVETSLGFKPENVNWEMEVIEGTTKGGERYNVPMTKALKEKLRWACAAMGEGRAPLVTVWSRSGEVPTDSAARKALAKAQRRAGVPGGWGFHDLRRTAARELYRRTRDIFKVQRLLSHRDIGTTVDYLGELVRVELKAEELEREVKVA